MKYLDCALLRTGLKSARYLRPDPIPVRMGLGKHLKDPDLTNNGKQGGGNVFTWEEIQRHANKNDQWLVIDRKVYNITNWTKRHPGGIRVISHYAGEDATVNMLLVYI